MEPIKNEIEDDGSNSKKKKKKKTKKKQKNQKSTEINEGTITFTNQAENTLVENEKSVKIRRKKKKKQKHNNPINDLETPNFDHEHWNSEINKSECNDNQEIKPSSGNDINGTSFNDDRGITMTENHEKVKRHKKSKKKKSKHKHQHEETAEHSFVQHESAGNEVLLNDD